MAVWQFPLEFIPRRNLLQVYGRVPTQLPEEDLWRLNLEIGVLLPKDFHSVLVPFGLPNSLSWGPKHINFGNYDQGSHVTITYPDSSETEVAARLHAGECTDVQIGALADFAAQCDCLLLAQSEMLIEPAFELIERQLKNSRAYRFCMNPRKFLLSKEAQDINWSVRRWINDGK